MAASAVTVPSSAIRETLSKAGFRLLGSPLPPDAAPDQADYEASFTNKGSEEVWYRHLARDRNFVVKVFSSVTNDREAARDVGKDAIRVAGLKYKGKEKGWVPIFKFKRVHRTGTIERTLTRMLGRAREAYGLLEEERRADWVRENGPIPPAPASRTRKAS
jgi:hypothetical protein